MLGFIFKAATLMGLGGAGYAYRDEIKNIAVEEKDKIEKDGLKKTFTKLKDGTVESVSGLGEKIDSTRRSAEEIYENVTNPLDALNKKFGANAKSDKDDEGLNWMKILGFGGAGLGGAALLKKMLSSNEKGKDDSGFGFGGTLLMIGIAIAGFMNWDKITNKFNEISGANKGATSAYDNAQNTTAEKVSLNPKTFQRPTQGYGEPAFGM